ncbi:hypothetical protein NL676_039011, partial [Syzygium grande]
LSMLKYLNMSFNELEGQVPEGGVFLNASAVSVFGNGELCGGAPGLKLPLCKSPSSNKSSSTKAIVIYVVAVSLSCIALLFLSILCYRKKKQTRTDALTSLSFEHQFLRISYEELLRATDRFSETNLIGKGRYGTVYKGILDSGAMVAVKVLNLMQRGASKSFVSECQTLGTIRHRNLVKILSVCSSVDFHGNDFKALIYEFMANESLEEWLHPGTIGRDDEHGESRNLRLAQRLNIAIDIATAIEYLHKGCHPAIVHGDLKPSNVLLDNDMVARVGDFGLAKIISTVSTEATGIQDQGSSTSTAVRGSIGYVPPEYGMGHKVSIVGDAYSYGILLLEMFTGKRPTEEAFGHCLNLHSFVQMALPDRAMEIVDLRLWSEAGDRQQEIKIRDCIISVFEIGVACSMESPPDRMDMTEVIRKLYSIKVSYETNERRTDLRRAVTMAGPLPLPLPFSLRACFGHELKANLNVALNREPPVNWRPSLIEQIVNSGARKVTVDIGSGGTTMTQAAGGCRGSAGGKTHGEEKRDWCWDYEERLAKVYQQWYNGFASKRHEW